MEISLAPNWLALTYLLIHTLLVLKSNSPSNKKIRIFSINLILLLFFGFQVIWGRDLSTDFWLTRFTLLWSPIIFFWVGYLWAGHTLTSIHPPGCFFDHPIARFEKKYLGQPSLQWGLNRSRLVTEIFHFGYFSYYFYTVSLGIYYDATGQLEVFQTLSFAVNFGYVVSYTCFALIPVAGPRWFLVEKGLLKEGDLLQPGYLFTKLTHKLLYGGPAHKGGAMPSSHSSTAFVFFFFVTYSWGWVAGTTALLIVLSMWIGAIFGRYHYLVDVVAGILLGGIGVLIAQLI